MQHVTHMELVHRAVRCQVCVHCHRRPKGSESLGPKVPRSCECNCPIFLNLPALHTIAEGHLNEPGRYEQAVRQQVCASCTLSDSAGEFCADELARTCPLAAYGKQVIEVIEGLLAVQ